MADIFLSYARDDSARATVIAQALEAEGFHVFWDTEIPPGRTWADYIEAKLANAHAVLVLWSESSTRSQWVREEARIGRDKGKLIPVLLDSVMPPFGFGEVQAASLAGWDQSLQAPQWRRLCNAIRDVIDARGQASAPAPAAAPRPSPPVQPAAVAPPHAPPPAAKSAGVPPWAFALGGVILAAVIGIGAVLGLSQRGAPPPAAAPVAAIGGPTPAAVAAAPALPSGVEAVVAQARANADAGRAAAERAITNAAQGREAIAAAQARRAGFGVQEGPAGVLAGNLAALQANQEAAIGLSNQAGLQFAGLFQLQGDGYTMDGQAAWGVLSASGRWVYEGNQYRFVGVGAITGRFTLASRESGAAVGLLESAGAGVISYPDGRRYEGEYRGVGEGPESQVFRHGLGALYGADGRLIEAGRFDNDTFLGAG